MFLNPYATQSPKKAPKVLHRMACVLAAVLTPFTTAIYCAQKLRLYIETSKRWLLFPVPSHRTNRNLPN